MRYLLTLAPVALLAACGGNKAATNNVSGNATAAPANAAAPSVTMAPAAPATSNSASASAAGGDRRANLMGECTEHMSNLVPPGRTMEICNCAVDRVLNNREGEEAATMACSAALNIPVDRSKL